MLTFPEALTRVYLENPCQVLPNALWKTLAEVAPFHTAVETHRDGTIARLEASTPEKILVYWTRDGRRPGLMFSKRLETARWALIHQDYLTPDTVAGFETRLSFFRLIHRGQAPAPDLPAGFRFETVSPDQAVAVADFIARCYDDMKPTADTVTGWTQRAVYAPNLWLWVMDEGANSPAALVIGEFDDAVRELSLEWVQTLPDYQRRGLGRAAVLELLRRGAGRAAFATVSGQVEDRENPGAFYRRCGFTGGDVWWLLAR